MLHITLNGWSFTVNVWYNLAWCLFWFVTFLFNDLHRHNAVDAYRGKATPFGWGFFILQSSFLSVAVFLIIHFHP